MNKLVLKIKDAASILGVHVDTLKYWEEKRMINPAKRDGANNYRIYSEKEIREIAKSRGIYDVEVDAAILNYKRKKGLLIFK